MEFINDLGGEKYELFGDLCVRISDVSLVDAVRNDTRGFGDYVRRMRRYYGDEVAIGFLECCEREYGGGDFLEQDWWEIMAEVRRDVHGEAIEAARKLASVRIGA